MVALVGYAMFATIAGTSVAVDGTNTSSHGGHDLCGELAWARTPLKIHAHHSPIVVTYTVGLHCKLRVAARQRIQHVSAFESIETGGKIFICSRESSSGRRQ